MVTKFVQCIALSMMVTSAVEAAEPLAYGPIPYPEVNSDVWMLIEYWPRVKDITLSAYFMDRLSGKNQSLCEATKRALDRDAEEIAKREKTPPTAYRLCYTLRDAVKLGYVSKPEN